MTVSVSFAVQAHPERYRLAAPLARKAGADVVYDPEPDSELRSPWRTYRHLLETTPSWATHRLQLQDDVEVCEGFHDAAIAAIESQPDRLICFYVGGNPTHHADAVREACARDDAWVDLKGSAWWCPAVCTAWPAGMIEPFLTWVTEQQWTPKFYADDEIIGRWLKNEGIVPLASVPSLVNHPDMVESLTGRRTAYGEDAGRVAACWVGDCLDCAAGIDWSRGPS